LSLITYNVARVRAAAEGGGSEYCHPECSAGRVTSAGPVGTAGAKAAAVTKAI
jgi:hypothetical protein